MRAAIYARLSDVRKGDTEGIERQIREARAHADRIGLEVVEELVDNDLSAAKRKRRPAFERLMEGIAADEWDAVVLRSLDRWVRRPDELERIIEVVERSKVRVEAIHGQIDLRTRNGRLQARVVTAVAMAEVEATQERVRDWHADRAAQGLPGSGRIGFGYHRTGTEIEVVEVEAELIRDAARRVIGGEPLATIGREWGRDYRFVKRVLTAERTAGLRDGEPAQWEPILDRFTWERLRSVLNHPGRRTQTHTSAYLLTGIASCWKCRRTLNSQPMPKARKYACRHCGGVTISAERVEEHVEMTLFARVDRPDLNLRPDVDVDALAAEILSIETDLEGLMAERTRGEISKAEWKVAQTVLNERLVALRSQISRPVRHEWQGRGSELAERWDRLPLVERRSILRAWVADVEVGPAVVGSNRFDARRVTMHWRD